MFPLESLKEISETKENLIKRLIRIAPLSNIISEKEARILWMRMGYQGNKNWTFEEIAMLENVSITRAKRLYNFAISKMAKGYWKTTT